jgi:hypothetical protein
MSGTPETFKDARIPPKTTTAVPCMLAFSTDPPIKMVQWIVNKNIIRKTRILPECHR